MGTLEETQQDLDAPRPENLKGIELWQQFEQLDDETKKAIFGPLGGALYHSTALGLTKEQISERKELFQRLLSDTNHQWERSEASHEPVDQGHDR